MTIIEINEFDPLENKNPVFITDKNVLIFETNEELGEYVTNLHKDSGEEKKAYITNVKQLHSDLFTETIKSLDYTSWEEVNSAIYSKYKDEASSLLEWYWNTWNIVEEYLQKPDLTITEQDFINSLPKFKNNG